MKDITPEEIIETFDRCLIYIYGQRYARENPHKLDKELAKKWIDEGCDLFLATISFVGGMNRMHEQSLHHRPGTPEERKFVPTSLAAFNDNIHAAIRRHVSEGEISSWDSTESQWRARLSVYKRTGQWIENMWGPEPGQPGCRAPQRLIDEII